MDIPHLLTIEEFDKDTKVKEKGRTSVGQRSELFTKL